MLQGRSIWISLCTIDSLHYGLYINSVRMSWTLITGESISFVRLCRRLGRTEQVQWVCIICRRTAINPSLQGRQLNAPYSCPLLFLRYPVRLVVNLLIALGQVLAFLARFPVGRPPWPDVSTVHFVDLYSVQVSCQIASYDRIDRGGPTSSKLNPFVSGIAK